MLCCDQHSGVPTKETCPHGWVAVRYSYFPRAGDAKGRERTRLEQAAIPILAANTEAVGRLSVTIRCARRLSQLASTSLLSKLLDPFLQIVYKGRSYSTSVAFNSSEPRWDETFSFEVSDLNAELQRGMRGPPRCRGPGQRRLRDGGGHDRRRRRSPGDCRRRRFRTVNAEGTVKGAVN